MTRTVSLLALLAVAFGASTALAESAVEKKLRDHSNASEGTSAGESGYSTRTGNPSESSAKENVQPGPLEEGPANPAAADDPAARIPTTKPE